LGSVRVRRTVDDALERRRCRDCLRPKVGSSGTASYALLTVRWVRRRASTGSTPPRTPSSASSRARWSGPR